MLDCFMFKVMDFPVDFIQDLIRAYDSRSLDPCAHGTRE